MSLPGLPLATVCTSSTFEPFAMYELHLFCRAAKQCPRCQGLVAKFFCGDAVQATLYFSIVWASLHQRVGSGLTSVADLRIRSC